MDGGGERGGKRKMGGKGEEIWEIARKGERCNLFPCTSGPPEQHPAGLRAEPPGGGERLMESVFRSDQHLMDWCA